jgi:hypothetical protein
METLTDPNHGYARPRRVESASLHIWRLSTVVTGVDSVES